MPVLKIRLMVLQAHLKVTQAEAQIKAFKRACKD
jgi:hypothetical protein